MTRFHTPTVFLRCLLVGFVALATVGRAPADDSLATMIPGGAVAVVTLRGGAGSVEAFRDGAFWRRAIESDAAAVVREAPQFQEGQKGLNFVRGVTGMTIWELAAAALGDEACLAIYPGKAKEPRLLLLVQHRVAARTEGVERLLNQAHLMAGLMLDDKPDPEKTHRIGDLTVWPLAPQLFQALVDKTVILSNDRGTLDEALAKRASKQKRLSDDASYAKACASVPGDAALWAFADIEVLRRIVPDADWSKKLPNPLAALLFSDWSARLQRSTSAVAWLSADRKAVSLEARLFGPKEPATGISAAKPSVTERLLDAADLPRGLSHFRIARDFEEWWASREQTMTEKAVADFSNFVATMTTLIGGLDFSDQFLPQLMPELQFLSANQEFDKDKSPSPVLPSFAMVFRLKDAEKFGPRLDSASLMGLTFLNAAAAEQKGPQLLIQADQYNGHKITYGRYAMNESAAATQAAKADIRYNFSPAMARVDDHVIVSSTYEFARDIMDVLAKPSQAAGTKARDEWYVHADELFRILHSNRETFVAQQMLEKDLEKAQAERMIDALLGTARWFKDVRITSELLPDGVRATLRIGLADAAK